MNHMKNYDRALMEGVATPRRMAKLRMRAFVEAVSQIAPRALVEAVVTAHKALFEFGYGRTTNGVRYVHGAFASDPRKSNNWGTHTIYNGNDLVATDSNPKPPTSGGTNWHLQSNTGTAAYRQYDDVHTYQTRQRIDPRGRQPSYDVRYDDPWANRSYVEAPQPQQPPPPPPQEVELPAPQAVRQQAPQPAPTQQECPPVCPAPKDKDVASTATPSPAPAKPAPAPKKPAAQYKWNPKDFQEIQGEGCSETHKFVINLVSYNKNNRGAAMSTARYLSQEEHIPGIYTYQFDGLAQNTTRPDVWRVRIGYFKSRAAARYFFRKYVFPHVGRQFNWWVGTCDGEKGDTRIKPNTFALGKNIKENECVDTSVAKQSSEQPQTQQNAEQQPANTQTQTNSEQTVSNTASKNSEAPQVSKTDTQKSVAPQGSTTESKPSTEKETDKKEIMDLVKK